MVGLGASIELAKSVRVPRSSREDEGNKAGDHRGDGHSQAAGIPWVRPGQWTHYLASLGIDAEGIDPVPEFIESAQSTYPGRKYRIDRAEDLAVADHSLGGVLAWYSLIHVDPERLSAALNELARCIRRGGGLALGFFTGPELDPFDHAITTAYFWPLDLLTAEVEGAGFTIIHSETRTDLGARPHGVLLVTRN